MNLITGTGPYDFHEALEILKDGGFVARKVWIDDCKCFVWITTDNLKEYKVVIARDTPDTPFLGFMDKRGVIPSKDFNMAFRHNDWYEVFQY